MQNQPGSVLVLAEGFGQTDPVRKKANVSHIDPARFWPMLPAGPARMRVGSVMFTG